MIAGGGEQLTLRAVARFADACNVGGSPEAVKHKFAVLRGHCESEQRRYEAIERTNITSFLLARDEASLAAKRQRLAVPASYYGFAGTISQVTDLVGQYREAGVQLLISSAYKNDLETHELLAANVMPHFA
jgi:alkanesulfonate monooxygenase SsuD/methylene tetrahydromethanopterin reductase-like flavin-dependent oxidoreductase (luciferase family)